jgi:hypothetical protein
MMYPPAGIIRNCLAVPSFLQAFKNKGRTEIHALKWIMSVVHSELLSSENEQSFCAMAIF